MPKCGLESQAAVLSRLNQKFMNRLQDLNAWYLKEASKIDKSIALIQNDTAGSCAFSDASTDWPSHSILPQSPGNISYSSSRVCDFRSPAQNRGGHSSASSPSSALPFSSATTPFEVTGVSVLFSPNQTSQSTNRRPSFFTSPNLPCNDDQTSQDGEKPSHLNTWCTLANAWGVWYAPHIRTYSHIIHTANHRSNRRIMYLLDTWRWTLTLRDNVLRGARLTPF